MARKRSQNSVSLFPFLAVLVCTMGALILLLLLTTRRIQKQQDETIATAESTSSDEETFDAIESDTIFNLTIAENQKPVAVPQVAANNTLPLSLPDPFADAPTPKPEDLLPAQQAPDVNSLTIPEFGALADASTAKPAEPKPTNFELQVRVDDLSARLEEETIRHQQLLEDIKEAEARLATDASGDTDVQMEQLSSLKRQEEVLRTQLEGQQLAINELNQRLEKASKTTEDAESILQNRESALVSLRTITKEHSDTAVAGTDKTLLEFSNATGTSKRPIIIDVLKDRFVFQPANVAVSAKQMEGFPQNDNPLLAGIAAAHDLANPNSIGASPYVLLLVRPNGALSFYAAQRTLKNANIHFGYELVDQGQDIVSGKPDVAERNVIATAVDLAMTRQQNLYGDLIAQVQKHQSPQNKPSNEPRLLPDGRIAMPGESGHDSFGKFFAGGERPPSPLSEGNPFGQPDGRRQAMPQTPQHPVVAEAASETESFLAGSPVPGTVPNPFSQAKRPDDADEYLQQLVNAAPEHNPLPEQSSLIGGLDGTQNTSDTQSPDKWLSGLLAGGENNQFDAGASFEDGPSSVLKSMLGNPRQPTAPPQPQKPQLTPEQARRAEEVSRLNQLAGNFGLGGYSQTGGPKTAASETELPPNSSAPSHSPGQSSAPNFWTNQFTDANSSSPIADSQTEMTESQIQASAIPQSDFGALLTQAAEETAPNKIDLSWLNETLDETTPTKSLPSTSSNPDSQLTPDWSESATAPADSTTRTVGAPENPFYVEAAEGNYPGGQPGESAGGPTVQHEATDENLISKFLRSVDAELDEARPDPALLTMLDSANSRANGQFAGRHPVAITMKKNMLQVGSSATIDASRLNGRQLLDKTLDALASEMDSKPAKAGRFALPFIDWQFDEPNRHRQQELQKRLEQMDVPSRRITLEQAKPSPEVPVLQWPAFDQRSNLQESADPINIRPPARSERGLSL